MEPAIEQRVSKVLEERGIVPTQTALIAVDRAINRVTDDKALFHGIRETSFDEWNGSCTYNVIFRNAIKEIEKWYPVNIYALPEQG